MSETDGSPPRDEEVDDPGRDPEGLDPPRDFLDKAGTMPEEGSFSPRRQTQPRDDPDEPPTSTGTGGP